MKLSAVHMHASTLCRKLGKWRDQGIVPYGMFTDQGGGLRDRTANEIEEQLKVWRSMSPARLPADGYLHALLVEHQSLVSQIEEWCDGQALVVSSAGQLRRENLWHAAQEWKRMQTEMHAKGILVYGLLDYDKGGGHIANAHSKWFKDIAALPFVKWGLTPEQLKFLGLPEDDDAQIDGAFGRNPLVERAGQKAAWTRRRRRRRRSCCAKKDCECLMTLEVIARGNSVSTAAMRKELGRSWRERVKRESHLERS